MEYPWNLHHGNILIVFHYQETWLRNHRILLLLCYIVEYITSSGLRMGFCLRHPRTRVCGLSSSLVLYSATAVSPALPRTGNISSPGLSNTSNSNLNLQHWPLEGSGRCRLIQLILQETGWAVGWTSLPIAMGKLRLKGNSTYSEA